MDTQLPDEIRRSLDHLTESLDTEDRGAATELLLLALAATYAAQAKRGKPPPDWITQLPCYPPQAAEVRRLVEEVRKVMGTGWPWSERWNAAAESLLADAENASIPEPGE